MNRCLQQPYFKGNATVLRGKSRPYQMEKAPYCEGKGPYLKGNSTVLQRKEYRT